MWVMSITRSLGYAQRVIPEEFSKASLRYANSCSGQLQRQLHAVTPRKAVVTPFSGPMGGKKTHYVVKEGRKPGIYRDWEEAKKQVNGYKGAVYKGFSSEAEAQAWAGRDVPSQPLARVPAYENIPTRLLPPFSPLCPRPPPSAEGAFGNPLRRRAKSQSPKKSKDDVITLVSSDEDEFHSTTSQLAQPSAPQPEVSSVPRSLNDIKGKQKAAHDGTEGGKPWDEADRWLEEMQDELPDVVKKARAPRATKSSQVLPITPTNGRPTAAHHGESLICYTVPRELLYSLCDISLKHALKPMSHM
eukprot:4769529-Pyramimonas_sp.AAC.4